MFPKPYQGLSNHRLAYADTQGGDYESVPTSRYWLLITSLVPLMQRNKTQIWDRDLYLHPFFKIWPKSVARTLSHGWKLTPCIRKTCLLFFGGDAASPKSKNGYLWEVRQPYRGEAEGWGLFRLSYLAMGKPRYLSHHPCGENVRILTVSIGNH